MVTTDLMAPEAPAAPVITDARGRWEAACAAFEKADKAARARVSTEIYDAHFDALFDVQYRLHASRADA